MRRDGPVFAFAFVVAVAVAHGCRCLADPPGAGMRVVAAVTSGAVFAFLCMLFEDAFGGARR